MATKTRMSFEDRQKLIVARVREIFAQRGLEGATTRELAQAAGVSEGLIFKHFPTKQALFQAMIDSIEKELPEDTRHALELPPSTGALVAIVRSLANMLLLRRPHEMEDVARMYLRSLAGDGVFADILLRKPQEDLFPRLEESMKAAMESGDVVDTGVPLRERAWFAERLIFVLMAESLPIERDERFHMAKDRIVEDVTSFILRGMGLKEEAIRSHCPTGSSQHRNG